MNKNIIKYGLIAGSIITAFMVFTVYIFSTDRETFKSIEWIGFPGIFIAFSMIFLGIKNFRDQMANGELSFGKAFKIGFLIALIASTMYVITWMIIYHTVFPNFIEEYNEHMLNLAKAKNPTPEELTAKIAELDEFKTMYKKPIFTVLLTYAEVFPIGIIFAIVSAVILKKKRISTES
jgi:hypothetical protein